MPWRCGRSTRMSLAPLCVFPGSSASLPLMHGKGVGEGVKVGVVVFVGVLLGVGVLVGVGVIVGVLVFVGVVVFVGVAVGLCTFIIRVAVAGLPVPCGVACIVRFFVPIDVSFG